MTEVEVTVLDRHVSAAERQPSLPDVVLRPATGNVFEGTVEQLATDVDFLGRTAVEAARVVAPPRRVVSFVVGDPTAYPWGGELVLRDGRPVGQVTSAAWGGTIGAGVGLALVGDREVGEATGEWVRTGEWTIDVGGDRHPLAVGLRPPLDPLGLRLRRAASDTH